ncbi:MAG: BrxA/BrxB family bacilliredoxin [Weeksellaceae bacterium]|jgi:putative YphP/YqiW family bacilliredoxin|nr:BrxA/BrxB family bacilliredoxin [Weeksellaceae bacterium]
MYPEEIVMPLKHELTSNGFEELTTKEMVDEAMKRSGTTLVMINSVCGCAARAARPGVLLSLEGNKVPDHLVTVFAGFDFESTERVREFLQPFPPSSPSVALFKDGELVHMLERYHIEGHRAEAIADNLKQAYQEFV